MRSSPDFDNWFCEIDNQVFEVEREDHDPVDGSIDRAFKMFMPEDQVPKALRAMMPAAAANKFFVKVVARVPSPKFFDEQNAYL